MYQRTIIEAQQISKAMNSWFGESFVPGTIGSDEAALIDQILEVVDEKYRAGLTYVSGSAMDYALMAQALVKSDPKGQMFRPDLTEDSLFDTYHLVTERAGKTANTLTLTHQKLSVGMRKFEEQVVQLFRSLGRGYPSAYVYNTGQWRKTTDLLVMCFQLSSGGHYRLCQRLIDYVLEHIETNTYFGRDTARPRLFLAILRDYPRSEKGENGGLTFQAMAYGFFYSDRQHLEFAVDKVRTGSSRQNRFGDVDGYYGLDLELSVEVKDLHITSLNLLSEVGNFMEKVARSNIKGIVFADKIAEDAVTILEKAGITPFSLDDVLWIVETWDWPKQDRAVHAMLHYLAHIEQNPKAVARLLKFIRIHDNKHPALAYSDTVKEASVEPYDPAVLPGHTREAE